MPNTSDTYISIEERQRRNIILHDIHKQIDIHGPHHARPHTDRARQFMPFAALRGYDAMIAKATYITEQKYQ